MNKANARFMDKICLVSWQKQGKNKAKTRQKNKAKCLVLSTREKEEVILMHCNRSEVLHVCDVHKAF